MNCRAITNMGSTRLHFQTTLIHKQMVIYKQMLIYIYQNVIYMEPYPF